VGITQQQRQIYRFIAIGEFHRIIWQEIIT
jgi:hypothetical protein